MAALAAALLLAAHAPGSASDRWLEGWQLHPCLPLLVPRSHPGAVCGTSGAGSVQEVEEEDTIVSCSSANASSAVLTYFDSDVALPWLPWPRTIQGHGVGAPTTLVGPWLRAATEAADHEQQQAHEAAISALPEPGVVLGYASWLTSGASRADRPLILRETAEHTGTRVWEAAWLHRSWALDHPELFQPVAGVQREIIELGSGVGVLGLTVAASHRASVTVSDFSGHFQSGVGTSVVHNLWANCMRNQKLVKQRGGSLRVLQLDWSRPSAPQLLPLPADIDFDIGSVHFELPVPTPNDVAPADVMLATEVLYTEHGAELFADTVSMWLRRPSGTLWLMNNPLRAGLSRFPTICSARGLMVTEIERLEWRDQARSMFSNQSAKAGYYTLYKACSA